MKQETTKPGSADDTDSDEDSANYALPDLVAYIAGFAAFAIAVSLQFLIVNVYSAVAIIDLIESLSSSALYYAAALATASATILGLLFTVIGMTKKSDESFEDKLYPRVARLAVFCVAMLIGSVFLLLLLTLPVGDFDKIPGNWYQILYYVLAGFVSVLTGLAVTVILILFAAVRQVLKKLTPLKNIWGRTES